MNRNEPEDLVRELLSSNRSIAQDTMEDGFTTLHTKEGVPYIANLDPEEKARYSETKIPLSKIKKDGKGGKELTTGKKDKKADTDSNLTDLQKKIKALTEGKEYTEEVANKVGDVMRQELEKNKDFKALVDEIEYKRGKFDEIQNKINEFNKTYMTRAIRLEEKDPDVVAYDKALEGYRKDYHSGKIDYDTFHQKTSDTDFMTLKEKRDNAVNKIYSQLDKERNELGDLREYLVNDKETINKMIGVFREQFKDVIQFADTKNMYL